MTETPGPLTPPVAQVAAPAATAPAPMTDTETASTALVLQAPAPVAPVAPQQAGELVPVEPAKAAELKEKARQFAEQAAALDPHSPDFTRKVAEITGMGDREIAAAASVSNRMLERPAAALAAAKGEGPEGAAQRRVGNALVDLRRTVEDLDPKRVNATGLRRMLGSLPFGNRLRTYFARYQSAQTQLDKIIRALQSGQTELRKDNNAIEKEKVNLWNTMGRLQEFAVLTGELDAALTERIDAVTDPATVEALRSDVLFVVRQRRQDLLTQLAVSVQGYLALDVIRRNNDELVRGVDRATTTTVSALRTAVLVAQALANQKLVLDQISALSETTTSLIESTAQMLRTQTGQVQAQAAAPTVGLDALRSAFHDIYATIDAIDAFRAQAVDVMGQTVGALETEVRTAHAYLERSHADDARRDG